MRSFKLVIALVSAISFVVSEDVVTLTSSNFQDTIKNNEYVLVEFYAPWCGHCKKLAPEYEKAANALKASEPKVILAKVDATAEDELAKEFGVRGFPTLKWFVNGQVTEYTGGREEKTIISWIVKKTGPAAKVVSDKSALEEFKKEGDAVVVGIFKDEAEAKSFLKHAQTDDEVPYAVCYTSKAESKCEEVSSPAQVQSSSFPSVIVYQAFDEGKAVFSGDVNDSAALKKFVSGNSMPLIVPFSQQVAPKIFGGEIKNHLLIFIKDKSEAAKLSKDLSSSAVANKGEVLFVTVEKTESRIVDFFGVKPEEMPTVRLVKMGEDGVKKYKYTQSSIDSENVSKFIAEYFAGNLKMDLKSEEPLEESKQGPVRVLVGKDFNQVVKQPGKDVLVEFYAPWCGHCKKLEPEYTAVGEHFKDNDNIIIAKMDSTANEVEAVSISGFPTLKFFPADSDQIVDYDGARDKEGIIKFLEENAKSLKK